MEKCVHTQLSSYCEIRDYITPDQLAYLKHNATQPALLKVTNKGYHNIENGFITGVCFLDVSKCFDVVSHDTLLLKMQKYGIRNIELNWFKLYLSNRSQATKCNNLMSLFVNVSTGIPQGSILAPSAFLLFINDLPMYVKNCSLYADDAMTEATGSTVEEVVSSLQCNINQLNASKWCTMLIGTHQLIGDFVSLPTIGLCLDGVQITNSDTFTYLGVHFDSFLTFNKMTDKICNM